MESEPKQKSPQWEICFVNNDSTQLPDIVVLKREFPVAFKFTSNSSRQIVSLTVSVEVEPMAALSVKSRKIDFTDLPSPQSWVAGKGVKDNFTTVSYRKNKTIGRNESVECAIGVCIRQVHGSPRALGNLEDIRAAIIPVFLVLDVELFLKDDAIPKNIRYRSPRHILLYCPEQPMVRMLHVFRYDPLVFLASVFVALMLNWLLPNPQDAITNLWIQLQSLFAVLSS